MSAWRRELEVAHAEGFVLLDLLTAVDHGDELELVARVVDLDGGARLITDRIPADRPIVPTVADLFAAADWYERETAEMLGVVFDGHPDPRPLLLRTRLGAPPLRRSTILAARVAVPWPAAAEADAGGRGSRRRQQPPGVPDGWMRGETG